MDKQLFEQTAVYLTDIKAMVTNPETEKLWNQVMSFLESLSDDGCPPEKTPILCTNMGIGILKLPSGDPRLSAEYAMRFLNEALPLWSDEQRHEKAVTMHTLGIAHRQRRKTDPASMEEGIAWLKRALSVWTKESAPMDWASTLYELANIYIERIEGEPAENREMAIEYLNEALSVRTEEVVPMDWAMTMYTLGNAYMVRVKGDPQKTWRRPSNITIRPFRYGQKKRLPGIGQ